jgi:hypothetical protein
MQKTERTNTVFYNRHRSGWPDKSYAEATLSAMGSEGFSLGLSEPVVSMIGRYVRVMNTPIKSRKISALISKCAP